MNWLSMNRRFDRQSAKRALGGLRLGLVVVLMAVGFGFLYAPGIAEELAKAGFGREFRLVLGACHIIGGLALLVPRLAVEAAIVLGFVVAGSALHLSWEGVGIQMAMPVSLVVCLVIFGIGLRLRRRLDASAWSEMLARYADQQDALPSKNA